MTTINDLSKTTTLETADVIPVWRREIWDTRGATLGTLVSFVADNLPPLSGSGTVTSVGLTVPIGLTVSSSPVTTSGTIAISYAAGYSIPSDAAQSAWSAKQDALVSGTNIKTINGQSVLGAGDLTVSGGSSDHGALTGLGDDDHTQYHTDARGDARYTLIAHTGAGGAAHANATTSAAGFMSSADKTKLDGVASGATAVTNSDIRAQVEAELIAGTNVTITPAGSGATRTLTIAAAGGGGATNLSYTAATRVIASDTGTDATLPLVTSTDAGLAPASGGGTTNFLRADGAWAAPPGGGGVTDGDKGDITVSGSGATWTVDNGAITLAKMANIATSSIVGRVTAGTGVPEALTAANVRTIINVADGATANASDASLRDRSTHTGTQLAATISDFASAVAATAAVTANTAKVTNATHTGEVTGATALTIAAGVVTNAKLANVSTATIKGRATAGTGSPEDLTAAQVRTLINVADGATANSSDATLLNRANHTGTQAQSTITNLTTDLAAKAPLASPTFTGTVTLPAGQVVNGVTLSTAAGTSVYLRGDGTYATPSGGGGGALDDLTDVTITTPTNGQVLKYNGTAWVNGTDSTGGAGASRVYVGDTEPSSTDYDHWYTTTGKQFVWDGSFWFEVPGIPGKAGTNGTNGTNGTDGEPGPQGIQGITGSGGPTSVTLSADQAFSATTIADVTNMPTITLDANTDYLIELEGSFTSAVTTTGIGLALNVGGTVSRISGYAQHPVSATALGSCSQEANNAVTGATTGVRATGVPIALHGRWVIRMGGTGGTVQLRCRSEIASSAVTLQAGMRMRAFVL